MSQSGKIDTDSRALILPDATFLQRDLAKLSVDHGESRFKPEKYGDGPNLQSGATSDSATDHLDALWLKCDLTTSWHAPIATGQQIGKTGDKFVEDCFFSNAGSWDSGQEDTRRCRFRRGKVSCTLRGQRMQKISDSKAGSEAGPARV